MPGCLNCIPKIIIIYIYIILSSVKGGDGAEDELIF
jgi:hypothetical protein